MAWSGSNRRAAGIVVSEERGQALLGAFPGVRAVQPFLTGSRPALANVGVVRGIGSQQELSHELLKHMVVRIQNQEFRGALPFRRQRLSRLRAILQATRHRS